MGAHQEHMQFQRTMSFRLVSVHDNLERLGGQQATVLAMLMVKSPRKLSC
jgi:hypothetical protein